MTAPAPLQRLWLCGLALLIAALAPRAGDAVAVAAKAKARLQGRAKKNPIEKVVDLLNVMKKRVEEEGQKEKELFDKYTCFCTTGMANLQTNIRTDSMKVPQLKGSLDAAEDSIKAITAEIAAIKADLARIKAKRTEAEALRKKAARAFEKTSADFTSNSKALAKAISALEGGKKKSFLQTETAAVAALRQLASAAGMAVDRQEALEQVLSEDEGSEGRPSDEVLGILRQLQATMKDSYQQAVSVEKVQVANFGALMASSKDESETLTETFEKKQVRFGLQQVEVVNMRADLETTTKALNANKEFLKHMRKTCKTVGSTYTQHMAMRSEELITLAETIRILGSDESRALFRKRKKGKQAAAAASFIQMAAKAKTGARRRQAAKIIHAALQEGKISGRDIKLDLLLLALRGKKIGFGNIVKIIDDRVGMIRKEQKADDDKRDYCIKEAETSQRSLRDVKKKIADFNKAIRQEKEILSSYEEEIATLIKAIKQQDTATGESTAARKANHADFVEVMASNRAALDVLKLAKNRLLQFYNPKIAKFGPDKGAKGDVELAPNEFGPGALAMMRGMTGSFDQQDDQEEQAEEAAPLAFVQEFSEEELLEDDQEDDQEDGEQSPAMPAMPSKNYKKSSESSAGVMELLQTLEEEIRRDTQEAEIEEKNHLANYQETMKDAKEKRVLLVNTLMEKQAAKAGVGKKIHSLKSFKTQSGTQMQATMEYIADLKGNCDFLIRHYETRKKLRGSEEDSLRQAKDVLNGASG